MPEDFPNEDENCFGNLPVVNPLLVILLAALLLFFCMVIGVI